MTHALHLRELDLHGPVDGATSQLDAVRPAKDGREPHDDPPLPVWRRALSALFTVTIVAIAIYLWPAPLGGSSRFVIVSGDSMEPTYDYGDIVLTRERGRTEVGDAVVFAVPEGGAEGLLVIHRVLLVDNEGFFITQGDNRTTPDRWQLTEEDIVGQPVLHIPYGGYLIWLLQERSVIGALIGLIVVFGLWPKRDPSAEDDEADPDPDVDDVVHLPADALWLLRRLPASEDPIDSAAMDEANAWVDEQLAATPTARHDDSVAGIDDSEPHDAEGADLVAAAVPTAFDPAAVARRVRAAR